MDSCFSYSSSSPELRQLCARHGRFDDILALRGAALHNIDFHHLRRMKRRRWNSVTTFITKKLPPRRLRILVAHAYVADLVGNAPRNG
jgi:hypothetical protein